MLVCPGDSPCNPGYASPAPPPLVSFDGEWDDDEIATVRSATLAIGNALARAHNSVAMQAYRIGVYGSYDSLVGWRAFLEVYGGKVTMNRPGISCEVALGATCWGSWDGVNWQVNVYTNADGGVAGNYRFLIHEFGHGFESRVNSILGGSYVRNTLGSDASILRGMCQRFWDTFFWKLVSNASLGD